MTSSPFTDRERLVNQAYATSGPLAARGAIYQYDSGRRDLAEWAFSHVETTSETRVLDVGCGPGRYLAWASANTPAGVLVGADLSPGMAAETRANVLAACSLVADAQELPFPAETFDTVLSMHMLYHVPDIDRGVREIARVARREGRVLVVTNGERHTSEISALTRAAISGVSGRDVSKAMRSSSRFNAEAAPAFLERSLDIETVERAHRSISVPDAEPVVAYVDSVRSLATHFGADDDSWSRVLDAARARVQAMIDADGAWTMTADVSLFVCHPR